MNVKIISLLLAAITLFLILHYNYAGFSSSENYTCSDCNVILISIDSLRADHVGAYGYPRNTTPNMDKFSSEGILFKNYVAQAYLTPVTEYSLQTSLYPHNTGLAVSRFYDMLFHTKDPQLTLPQILNGYNYTTILVSTSPEFFFLFDEFTSPFNYTQLDGKRGLPVLNESVLSLMKSSKFLLWLPIGTVHAPYGRINLLTNFSGRFVDPKYNGSFKGASLDITMINNIYNNTYYSNETYPEPGAIVERINLSEADMNYIVDLYDSRIYMVDAYIGRLLKDLELQGLLNNTIVIIESEHGEEFGEHGFVMHYDIHDQEVHVPLIIKNPKFGTGVIDTQVQSIDILPTILDFLGIPKYEKAEGNTLVPLIYGESDKNFNKYVFIERYPLWEDFILTRTYPKIENVTSAVKHTDFAVRTNEWKLIYRSSREYQMKTSRFSHITGTDIIVPEFELYNLKEDPQELKNVYADNPAVAAELKEKLFAFVEKYEKDLSARNTSLVKTREIYPYP